MATRAITLNLEVEGDDPLAFAQLMIVGLADFRPVWPAVAKAWRRDMIQRFRSAGRSSGTPWPTYEQTDEEAYYRWYKAGVLGISQQEANRRLLRWSPGRERLFPSLINPTHPEHIDIRRRTSWTGGTRVPYAIHHDLGIGRAPEEQGGHAIPRRRLSNVSRRFQRRKLLPIIAGFGAETLRDAERRARAGDRDAIAQRSAIRAGLLTSAQARRLGAR